jgi:hypothetical protein
MTIPLQDADDILSKGFPDQNQLKRFPYGDLLCKLREDDNRYQDHGPKVLQAMNTLLGNDPDRLVKGDVNDDEESHLLRNTKVEIEKHFAPFGANTRALFRVAALYHDIGKYIIKERHPTIGWYTMEYLNPDHKDALRSLLGEREDYLQLLMVMVRDHDEFGVLATGEASYPILLRAANSLGNNLDDRKRIISAIMWLNLADIAATLGPDLTMSDVKKIIEDLNWFLAALGVCNETKERLDDYVIRKASEEDLVVQRIGRLLLESSRGVPKSSRLSELCKLDRQKEPMVFQKVRKQLETVYSTQIPRLNFCFQFTHICKLDYGKRFLTSLVEYYEGPPKSGEDRPLKKWAKEPVETIVLIYDVLAILKRITSTYSAMIRTENGPGNLIGVEMKDLTPNNAPEKTAQIIELLRESHYPGLSWMMSDCLAWYF